MVRQRVFRLFIDWFMIIFVHDVLVEEDVSGSVAVSLFNK